MSPPTFKSLSVKVNRPRGFSCPDAIQSLPSFGHQSTLKLWNPEPKVRATPVSVGAPRLHRDLAYIHMNTYYSTCQCVFIVFCVRRKLCFMCFLFFFFLVRCNYANFINAGQVIAFCCMRWCYTASYCITLHGILLPEPLCRLVDSCALSPPPPGIECPRSSRNTPGGMQVAEPFSEEAMMLTKELVLQREVRAPLAFPYAF